jgi:hypothetical protein
MNEQQSTERTVPTMKRKQHCSWRANLFWALLGAIAGDLSAAPLERAKDWTYETLYEGRKTYASALKLRKQAIIERSVEKHKSANRAFERSARAGNLEAIAQLGLAECLGLGMPRSQRAGYAKIIEAVKRDSRLTVYLTDPDVCPK